MTGTECIRVTREFLVSMNPSAAAQAEEALVDLAAIDPAELELLKPDLIALAELASAAASHFRHLLVLHGVTGQDYEPTAGCGVHALRA